MNPDQILKGHLEHQMFHVTSWFPYQNDLCPFWFPQHTASMYTVAFTICFASALFRIPVTINNIFEGMIVV